MDRNESQKQVCVERGERPTGIKKTLPMCLIPSLQSSIWMQVCVPLQTHSSQLETVPRVVTVAATLPQATFCVYKYPWQVMDRWTLLDFSVEMLFVWMCKCSGTGVKFREFGRSVFLASVVWVLGIEPRSLGLAADAFTPWATLQAYLQSKWRLE